MAGNTFGQAFRVSTFGESHGIALGAVVDGCPPGLPLSEADLQVDLDRRKPGQSKYTTQRKESDQVRIVSAFSKAKRRALPLVSMLRTKTRRAKTTAISLSFTVPRTLISPTSISMGCATIGGGGRSSARETVMRVAAGAIAKKYLAQQFGTQVRAYLSGIGPLRLGLKDWSAVEENPFFCADPEHVAVVAELIDEIRRDGNSIGAEVSVVASQVPVGLGEPVFGKIDGDLAGALMGINAVKAVAIGDGFDVVRQRGTEHRDEMDANGFTSNHAGGVLGGITSGQDLLAKVALKPTSSLTTPGQTQNLRGEVVEVRTKGRHDPCVGIRAVPIVEAMTALVLIDHVLRHRGQVASP